MLLLQTGASLQSKQAADCFQILLLRLLRQHILLIISLIILWMIEGLIILSHHHDQYPE